jgi:hypothetical protein
MTGPSLLFMLALLSPTWAMLPNPLPKSIKQQFSTGAVNDIKFLQILPAIATAIGVMTAPSVASAVDKKSFEYQPALAGLDYGKPRTYYPDFVQKTSGLQYKVVKEGDIYMY